VALNRLLPIDPLPTLLGWDDPALAYFDRRDLLAEAVAPVETLWNLPEAARLVQRQQPDGAWRCPGKSSDPVTGTNDNLLQTRRFRYGADGFRYGADAYSTRGYSTGDGAVPAG
jgi:hypothetical protein